MTIANNDFIRYTEEELTSIILRFANTLEESKARQISKNIIRAINWNDPTLMHKGLSWMAKNYLVQQNIM